MRESSSRQEKSLQSFGLSLLANLLGSNKRSHTTHSSLRSTSPSQTITAPAWMSYGMKTGPKKSMNAWFSTSSRSRHGTLHYTPCFRTMKQTGWSISTQLGLWISSTGHPAWRFLGSKSFLTKTPNVGSTSGPSLRPRRSWNRTLRKTKRS